QPDRPHPLPAAPAPGSDRRVREDPARRSRGSDGALQSHAHLPRPRPPGRGAARGGAVHPFQGGRGGPVDHRAVPPPERREEPGAAADSRALEPLRSAGRGAGPRAPPGGAGDRLRFGTMRHRALLLALLALSTVRCGDGSEAPTSAGPAVPSASIPVVFSDATKASGITF